MWIGIGASDGFGVGNLVRIEEMELSFEDRQVENRQAEVERFLKAVDTFSQKTREMAEDMRGRVGEQEAEILEGHVSMISDPFLTEDVIGQIHEGICAERAFTNTCEKFIEMFSAAQDDLVEQRITDIQDIQTRLLKILLKREEVDISQVPAGTILVARDFTPSMTVGIRKENVMGIVTEVGGKTSHSAILARALELPAVLSVPGIMEQVKTGQRAVLDGTRGIFIVEPTAEEEKEYTRKREDFWKEKEGLKNLLGKPTETNDGVALELLCNIGNPKEATEVLERDGEGVGLFRTEFLFMDRGSVPTEEEQFEAYKKVAETLKGKPVIIRTLDVGGDKEIPYLHLDKEENPFLGFRAIRVCLQKPDMYRVQLRALLRASAFGNIQIMVPMVTGLEELRAVKEMLSVIKLDLKQQQIAYNEQIKVGVMVETPAAALLADLLAKEVDFFSIGTNDLTQYTMTVDRGNAHVAYLYSTYQPSVLRSIASILKCAAKEGIPVGMCGEAAADPKLIPLWIAYGLQEFSVSATAVLATRNTIGKWSMEEAKQLACEVSDLKTEKEVVELLEKRMKQ